MPRRRTTAAGNGASSSASAASASAPSSASSPSTRHSRLKHHSAHLRALDTALSRTPHPDVSDLRRLSVGGFGSHSRRRVIWPLLLGVDVDQMDREAARRSEEIQREKREVAAAAKAASNSTLSPPPQPVPPAPHDYYTGVIRPHRYHDQIEKDIERSMAHFDVTKRFKQKKRSSARAALSRLIHTLFSLHPDLHYVQGFHDIASVFLLVCHDPQHQHLASHQAFDRRCNARGEELAYRLTERLALLHIRDSLRPTLDTVVEVMALIFPLLRDSDPEVHAFMLEAHVQSFFSLSWILTWFSHNLERLEDVCRVFDFFISSHPLMPVYATVALIRQMRGGLLGLKTTAIREARERYEESSRKMKEKENGDGSEEKNVSLLPPFDPSSVQVEMGAVHAYFQELPPLLDLDSLFAQTAALYARFPPQQLIRRAQINIPRDSPLLLEHGGMDELPSKLTNYLEWKRRQQQMAKESGDKQVQEEEANLVTYDADGRPKFPPAAVTSRAAIRAAAEAAAAREASSLSFYDYPSSSSSFPSSPSSPSFPFSLFPRRRRTLWLLVFVAVTVASVGLMKHQGFRQLLQHPPPLLSSLAAFGLRSGS